MAGWNACNGNPKPGAGTRWLPDGSLVIANRRGEEVRVAPMDLSHLAAILRDHQPATAPEKR